jgi:hypothetical protein
MDALHRSTQNSCRGLHCCCCCSCCICASMNCWQKVFDNRQMASATSINNGKWRPQRLSFSAVQREAIVHRRDLPFLRERRTRYAIFERRCGRHLQFMEVADAICLLWTPFAICGRHLPISRGCGRHLPILRGVDAICHLWRASGRRMPFMEDVDAICHFRTPFAY